MELRSCSNQHFFLAVRGGLVIKLPNTDCKGKPSLVFKKMEDIYATTDTEVLDSPATCTLRNKPVFYCSTEGFCLAERKTREIEPERNRYTCGGSDDEENSDLGDLEDMTLKQFKEMCKTRKRKVQKFLGSTSKQECTDTLTDEDKLDLEEPLSAWKSRIAKGKKFKRRCANWSVATSPMSAQSVKPQPTRCADNLQPTDVLSVPITVKAEVPDTEYSCCQNRNYVVNDSSSFEKQGGSCEEDSTKTLAIVNCERGNNEMIYLSEKGQKCCVNQVSHDRLIFGSTSFLSSDTEKILEVENEKDACQPSSFWPESESHVEEGQRCVFNQVCCDHVIFESTSLLSPVRRKIMKEGNEMDTCQSSTPLSVLESKEEQYINQSHISGEGSIETVSPGLNSNADIFAGTQSSNPREILRPIIGEHNVLVCNTEINGSCGMEIGYKDGLCTLEHNVIDDLSPNLENNSFSSPINNFSLCNSNPCLSHDDTFVHKEEISPGEETQLLESIKSHTKRSCLNYETQSIDLDNESHRIETNNEPRCANVEGEKNCRNSPYCVVNCTSEIEKSHCTEMLQSPERLLSRRKAISRTSQDRLCLAMKSIEFYEDTDHYKFKEKLLSQKETENEVSAAVLYNDGAKSSRDPKGPLKVNPTKITISPKQILIRPKNDKKNSPPKKGCLPKSSPDGSHPSRFLPRFSTGCTSIQRCSESTITFSQQQMQDIESVAMKLITELKSMKEIVEEKLFYVAYRTTMKNDIDVVKTVINNAIKTEETARKCLSIMRRDCNRFCKLMKLTENGATTSENVVQKEGKKITFADEAGGMLCHVKSF